MKKILNFDMDGTLADLYGVENWLDDLINSNVRPYKEAKAIINLSLFARLVNQLQRLGYELNIISWLAKNSDSEYDKAVTATKEKWLKRHLPSVKFDNVYIVEYGVRKSTISNGFLFDDEEQNLKDWGKGGVPAENIIECLKELLKGEF